MLTSASQLLHAMGKHRVALVFVILFFIFLSYFLIDNFLILQEEYISQPHQAIFVIGGLLALISSYLLMERNKVPRGGKKVLAMLFCLATVGALYPGLLRINQLTDSQGLQVYRYVFSETYLLLPEDKSMPRLALATNQDHKAYWSQYKAGDHYDIAIRKGGLGFYQIDMSPIIANIQQFYIQQTMSQLNNID